MEAVPGGGLSACSVQGSGSLKGPCPRRGLWGTLGFAWRGGPALPELWSEGGILEIGWGQRLLCR